MTITIRTFITISILLFLTGCSLLPGQDDTKLVGSWNWVSSQGGFVGHTLTPKSEGYFQTLNFHKDQTYSIKRDGKPHKQGTYEITIIEYDEENRMAIQYNSIEFYYAVIMELSDTLRLRENCADCYSHIYVRE